MGWITHLIGEKGEIAWWQMSIRAALILLFGLLLIRLFGRRAFGKQNPLDIVGLIIVGSNLSRALTGTAPFFPTFAGTAVLVVLFWLLDHGAARWVRLAFLVKGNPVRIAHDHQFDRHAMQRWGVTEGDLEKRPAVLAFPARRPSRRLCWSAAGKSARYARAELGDTTIGTDGGFAPPSERKLACVRPVRRIASRILRVWLRTPGCARAENGGRDERRGYAGGHDRRLSPGGGGAEAERGRHDLWRGRHPDHRSAAPGAGGGDPLFRLPARAVGRERGRDRRVSDPEAGHLHDGLGPRLSERAGRLGQRHDQLFPDDHDQRVERPGDRRSRAGRLRRDGPAGRGPALCQGGLPRQPAARHRHRHRAGDPRRRLGAPGRRLSRPDRRGAGLRSRCRDGEEVAGEGRRPGAAAAPGAGNRSRAPSNCWRTPSARS